MFSRSLFSPRHFTVSDRGISFMRMFSQLVLVFASGLLAGENGVAFAQRSLGLDISAWQGNISQSTWNNIHNNDNRDFVFIRSSRGGTTGYYNQSDPNNNNGQNTLSQRYDDPYFAQNIKRANQAGLFAGSYHFSRPEILTNTGTDEADHFIQMAGAWMRPGFLLPVHDLESGDGIRTDNEMAQFALDFSNRIDEVMGIRPAIYLSGNYAAFVVGGASASLRNQVVDAYPNLWSARWPNQANPNAIPIQTGHPKDSYSQIYGPWDDSPHPTHPWAFWQYASTGRLNSFNNGNSNLDLNVAQGGDDFLKDRLVPALWTTASDGQWTTLANWNSGQAPIVPVQGPGQVPRVGFLSLPTVRLPTGNDTVILARSDADITVTLASGVHDIRKLVVREALDITGGSLTVNYVPVAESTPYSAQFSAPVSLSGGSLSVHTLQVDASQTFSLGGTLTLDTLQLMPHSTTPAKILVTADVEFNPLADAAAAIVAGAGVGSSGVVDLGGADRTWQVSNGGAVVDLTIDVPLINGGITKAGPGLLKLSGANTYEGDTSVEAGTLRLADALLSDAADVYLVTLGVLDLDFSGTDVVDSLFIDGISQSAGTWGGLGSGAEFTSPFLEGAGLLQVSTFEAPIPGDFNNDGFVNGDDLAQWQSDFGLNGESDADDDSDSDGTDFLAWQRNLGMSAGSIAATQAVPEPSTALLLGVCGVLCVCRRRFVKS